MTDSPLTIGIDLGTTYSLAAVMADGKVITVPNVVGGRLTPSVVSLSEGGEVLVGTAAQPRLVTHPDSTASVFKRSMGTDEEYRLGGRVFRPEELSAFVLRALREDVEAHFGRPVREAVVSVPAYFGELQRRATRDACEIAGLHVERIINEPTAAAIAFGLHERHRELRAVVLDLGGGTFDVTVLEIIEGVIEIQSSAGDSRLGGEDFVDAFVDWATALLERDGAKPAAGIGVARLREACEVAKRQLTERDRVEIAIAGLQVDGGVPRDVSLPLSRLKAEELWQPVLERLLRPIHRALRDAGLGTSDVDEVILVGGATRMPCFVQLATKTFGKLPLRSLPPDEAVAMGAAVQAALKIGDAAVEDLVVTDVAPFTLGTSVVEELGGRMVEGIFLPILERGTVLPASRSNTVTTMTAGQSEMRIQVFQGEHSHCSDNQKLGEYRVKGIPKGPAGEQGIELRFTYDLNGLLEVESTILSTGKKATLVIENGKGSLSKGEVAKARRAMERIKFHPREALPNIAALNRADAMFAELKGAERAVLGACIASLRAALETQDPGAIEGARSELLALLSNLRPV